MAKGTELAKAYVQIIPSAEGIKDKLSSVLSKESSGAADSAGESIGKGLVAKIGSAVAAAGLGKMISSALMSGADLQQSVGGVETLFKDSADTVKQYAEQAYMTAGMSANEYMQTVTGFSASLLQGLGGDTAAAAEIANMALTDMSDNTNKMGTDMESIKNAYQGFAKQNYTMLDNLKLGYGGTKTEMERLLADAEKLSGVKYDITNLSDVYNAIHVIQEEMDITGTTAKEAASTFSGSFASMKAAAKNLLANLTLGQDIGADLFALQNTFRTFIFDNLVPMLGNLLSNLPAVIDGVLTMVIQSINQLAYGSDAIAQAGISIITGLADSIVYNIPYLIEAAYYLLEELGRILVETDWISVASDMISQLKGSLSLAAEETLGTDESIIQSIAGSITKNLPSILTKGTEILMNIANGILQSLPQLILIAGMLTTEFANFIQLNLPTILATGTQLLLELVNGIIDSLPAVIDAATQVIAQFLITTIENLPQILESGIQIIIELAAGLIEAIPKLVAVIPDIIQSIKNAFAEFDWKEIGSNIIDGIKNGIMNGAERIAEAARSAAQAALSAAKSLLGIASPSKEFYKIGSYTVEGFVNAIADNIGIVKETMKNMANSALFASDDVLAAGLYMSGRNMPGNGNNFAGTNSRIDMILAVLIKYLPECAKKINIDGDSIFNEINRNLGLAVTG